MGEGIEGLDMVLEWDLEMVLVLVRSLGLVLVIFWMMDRVSLRNTRLVGLWYPGHCSLPRRHWPQEGVFLSHCGGLIIEI